MFRDKLTRAKAKRIARLLESELPTALEAMMSGVAELDVDDEDAEDDASPEEEDARRGFSALFSRYLQERGRFHLWWD